MRSQLLITIIAFMICANVTSTSKYEGISWNKEKERWQVDFHLNGKKSKYYFDNELDAVKTRNRVYKRMVILSQNPKIQNQQVKEKTSQYKGVHWHKKTKKWYVQLHFKDGGTKSGGYFNDEQDAAKKVNQLCNEFEISEKNPGISGIPNQQVKQKTSQYIGVYWNKQNNKWGAQISFKNGNTLFGGYFNDELDAVRE